MKLIIGLGNPGKEYVRTRHNVGFFLLDKMQELFELPEFKFDKHSNADISKGLLEKKRVVLAKPQTFMNNSGQAVRSLLSFYKLTPADLIVIHDDKDIPLGKFRVQSNRGAAGHNGIKSLFDSLGTQDFLRLRVGIAPEKPITDTADFVLAPFAKDEQQKLQTIFDHVVIEVKNHLTKV